MAIFMNQEFEAEDSLRNMDVDLVGLDHAQLLTGFFFNHFQAVPEITHFGGEQVIDPLGSGVFALLLVDLLRHRCNALHASASRPQLHVKDHEQSDQASGNEA